VTRSGTNDFHGSAYFFYRDRNTAAFPLLARTPGETGNPYFVRKQPGAAIGAPIIKDKTFFFFAYERTAQVQALATVATDPAVAALDAPAPSPYNANLYNIRFDHHINTNNNMFLRYTHDGNNGFGPSLITEDPSGWANNSNWADQSIIGLTSTLTPNIVNDARFNYNYWSNKNFPTAAGQCQSPCVGGLLPTLYAVGGFAVGNNLNSPQARNTRRFEETDNVSWQKGSHRIRFGGDATRAISAGLWGFCTPYCGSVLTPSSVAAVKAGYAPYLGSATVNALFAGVPSAINTDADVNNLPVYTLGSALFQGIGVGPDATPAPYNRAANEPQSQYRLYIQDVWKANDRLTINYGLAWNGQTGWYPVGLNFPAYLAPIFGAGNTAPTSNNLKEFQPAFGFAWTPTKSKKTVIRGGAGIYWDGTPGYYKLRSGASIGPPGDGRATVGSTLFTNIYPGIFNFSTLSTIPVGAPIPISQITNLSVAQFTNIVLTQAGTVAAKLGQASPQTSGAYTVTGIDLAKTGVEMYPPGGFPLPRSYQTSIGVQQDLGHDIVLQADWARRQGENVSLGEVDMNHNNLYVNGAVSPVIPACTQAQLFVAGQECSTGAITVWTDQGRSIYEGLVMKVMKRLTHNYTFTVSYAFQELHSDTGYYNTVNWMSGYGQTLAHQNLNISGVYNLPLGFSLSLNSSMISATPATISIGNYPLPGDATTSQPLPGLPVDCANTGGCSKAQIASAVAQFNSTYAGTKAANGTVFPTLVLPSNYSLGQPLISQDLRLTKTFKMKERYQMQIMAEMFNALNVANLSGFSFTLDALKTPQSFAFGQATQRVAQTFGQGGPRAAQFGVRISF
ncbi:MAG TPA: hypothetical protein VEF06_02650, partial [Bryobacteraceae bacterium]|nr:hypothetical protein [Bryobacteraceae bacterium]